MDRWKDDSRETRGAHDGPGARPGTGVCGPTGVLLADDHWYRRRGMRAHLAELEGFSVVGEAADGLTALRLAAALVPDVLVLNIHLAGPSGLAVARRLRAAESPVATLPRNWYRRSAPWPVATLASVTGAFVPWAASRGSPPCPISPVNRRS